VGRGLAGGSQLAPKFDWVRLGEVQLPCWAVRGGAVTKWFASAPGQPHVHMAHMNGAEQGTALAEARRLYGPGAELSANDEKAAGGEAGGQALHQMVRGVEDGVVTEPRAVEAAARAVAGWQAGGEAGGSTVLAKGELRKKDGKPSAGTLEGKAAGGQRAVDNRLARRSGTLQESPAYEDICELQDSRPSNRVDKTTKELLTQIFDKVGWSETAVPKAVLQAVMEAPPVNMSKWLCKNKPKAPGARRKGDCQLPTHG
ncbi:hypothetical protein TSOC_005364, partial [Tetrabaena socialis]